MDGNTSATAAATATSSSSSVVSAVCVQCVGAPDQRRVECQQVAITDWRRSLFDVSATNVSAVPLWAFHSRRRALCVLTLFMRRDLLAVGRRRSLEVVSADAQRHTLFTALVDALVQPPFVGFLIRSVLNGRTLRKEAFQYLVCARTPTIVFGVAVLHDGHAPAQFGATTTSHMHPLTLDMWDALMRVRQVSFCVRSPLEQTQQRTPPPTQAGAANGPQQTHQLSSTTTAAAAESATDAPVSDECVMQLFRRNFDALRARFGAERGDQIFLKVFGERMCGHPVVQLFAFQIATDMMGAISQAVPDDLPDAETEMRHRPPSSLQRELTDRPADLLPAETYDMDNCFDDDEEWLDFQRVVRETFDSDDYF